MRLTIREFQAMNSAARRFLQRTVEFPLFQRMGLNDKHCDILEIGCGSGYGAVLLSTLSPRSYTGIDLMPEQIVLAQKRQLPNAKFMVRDATDLSCFPQETNDIAVIFGILHHIPQWREVIQECYRVLHPAGKLFVEEPDENLMAGVNRLFPGTHPQEAFFTLRILEEHLKVTGFVILERRRTFGMGFYSTRKP
ncbi:demethylmenaquinone methyltransferase / 2-methoxy-6-polyprenyl-1,4-benzoquinol methylase [Anaerolineales bacterium]|nr:demethylmenaquinone methyltransferase / 2-methoxy-6-polyprenyl-1,4-benzoquinol methylase [Anaerolineales bacterium]